VSYAIPFQYPIQAGRPLLIMACSATKRAVTGLVRFTELYDGPMWQQVRASGYPASNIACVSALYGFMEPGHQITAYDREMDEKISVRICGEGNAVWRLAQAVKAAGSAMVFGGALYRAVAQQAKRIEPDLPISEATGSYLQQRKQLGEWLRAQMEG